MRAMAINGLHSIYFFILLALLIGQGDGQWKKVSRDELQRDMKLYRKMSEKIKQEFEEYYTEYADDPINDYFLEEIDYVQSKIQKHVRPKVKHNGGNEVSYTQVNFSDDDYYVKNQHTKDNASNMAPKRTDKNSNNKLSATNVTWPKFDDILLAIGKQYDWKNDRWIKVKAKMKDKQIHSLNSIENNADHQKHNFKYRFVKLNRTKSKRKIVIAVTAVR
ncbi:uncharacterized protein LOC123657091 [Melitaea cinxia]|uniref:uncharacterized protein LOC123657091 n=1 Tax=Melitaea cinxia TaxID=113334 RepID=UPI001E271EED|nr:uncharacterized protein LOC123657091 [Melitaea cinxia]